LRCQLKFSKAYIVQNGLAYGEEIEQLWAKLTPLWCRLKQMRSENRIDTISSRLAFITAEMLEYLPQTLRNQFSRANTAFEEADNKLQDLQAKDANLTDDFLQVLYTRRMETYGGVFAAREAKETIKVRYVVMLLKKRFYISYSQSASKYDREYLNKRIAACVNCINQMLLSDPTLEDFDKVSEDGQAFSTAREVIADDLQDSLRFIVAQQQLGSVRLHHSGHSICSITS